MSTVSAKKSILGKTISLSMKKGLWHFFFLIIVWFFRLVIHAIALAPLAFSFFLQNKEVLALLPWLNSPVFSVIFPVITILLYVFAVIPLNFSKGEVITKLLLEEKAPLFGVFSFSNYGKKLKKTFVHIASVLPWALPLIALIAYLYYMMVIVDNGFAIFSVINNILGPTVSLNLSLLFCVAIVLLSIIITAYGFLRNSCYPYAVSLPSFEKRPRKKMNGALSGHRLSQLLLGLLKLLLLLPLSFTILFFLLAALYQTRPSIFSLFSSLPALSYQTTGWLTSFSIISFAFTVLLSPFRMVLPAQFLLEAKS